ncbi:RHS repeat-associated core domain-containing protein [Lacipirellula sp.]|uniref:RHS repeat-associated core domain-containing protein n=1 Tax=Lacipirellula sp. TaxID=2691419 RepID=UPI003D129899
MMSVTVDTLADVSDANDGVTSLREAIAIAPLHGSVVDFHTSLSQGVITLSGQLSITQAVTINGLGADKLAIAAGGNYRVFQVYPGVSATISGLKITGGNLPNSTDEGAGILNSGSLTLNSVEISGNTSAGVGGAISSRNYWGDGSNSLFINDSTITDNHAVEGSGIAAFPGGGAFQIRRSTISNNVSQVPMDLQQWSAGGGIQLVGAVSSPLIENSTISGNVSTYIGGIRLWAVSSPLRVVNTTIAFNRSLAGGVGLDIPANSASPIIQSSIIAQNTNGIASPVHFDVNGNLSSESSYSLFGTGVSLAGAGIKSGTAAAPLDPKLSPLDNYGGPNKTHVPLPGSPVIDAGGPTVDAPATDQRGLGRLIERDEPNAISASARDMGAVELSAPLGAVGDFNGDGRKDKVLFDGLTHSLQVSAASAAGGGYEIGSWGVAPSEVTLFSTFVVGDFNGDGRDDLLISSSGVYKLAISDGSAFLIQAAALPANWNVVYASDFDGDGSDEILGGTLSGGNYAWGVADYRDAFGLAAPKSIASLSGFAPSFQQFFQDVNRDGRVDIITRTSGSAPWMVRLAGAGFDGAPTFTAAADWNAWINYGYNAATVTLDADKALAKVIEEFSWVYNNVELELYPGFMKGVEATRQTKAGNDWDQAGLLEARLQALPFMASSDVKIVSANVRVSVAELQKWLGVSTPTAVYRAISATMDSNVKAYNASNTEISEPTTSAAEAPFNASVATIEFKHAWVRASVPISSGIQSIDLDPSWKFKERQDGIPLPTAANLNGGDHTSAGQFDEFDFLALDPRTDHRLPLEFFEDQAMEWLMVNQPGKSLADVPRREVIVTRQFSQVPSGLGAGVVVVDRNSSGTYDLGDLDQYSSLVSIADPANASSDALTHRVIITMKSGSTVRWTQELAVPIYSLDSIVVSSTSTPLSVNNSNADLAYRSTGGPYFSRLIVNGNVLASSNYAFYSSSSQATLEILHLAPQSLTKAVAPGTPDAAGPSQNDRLFRYTEDLGQVIAIGLEANQYSKEAIADKQGKLLAASATAHSETDLRKHVDDLTALTAAKYWYDFNRQNKIIEGLTQTIGGQQWVGSGIVKGDSVLLVDPDGSASTPGLISYLPYGMAPVDFGVDLPNINHVTLDFSRGLLNGEAWQLVGFNSSALEHNVVEEVIGAPSISTMKGLQQAFQRTLGLNANDAPITTDVVLEFTSQVVNNVRVVTHVGNWYSNGTTGVKAASPANVDITSNLHNYLTSTTAPLGQLRSHIGATTLASDIEALLSAAPAEGDIRILVPFGQTKLNEWVGGVYFVEKASSMRFMIVADSSSNGGYSGGVTLAPPKELQKGSFLNAGWAGDPVNVANGNMFRDETDIVYPNPGVPLTFSRHYDSQSLEDFGLGVGWTYSFGDVLYTEVVDGAVNRVWLDSAGRRHYFKPDGLGGYLVPSSLQGQVSFSANQGLGVVDFVFKSSDGLEYHFERVNYNRSTKALVGRLNRIIDSNGDGVVVKYDSLSNHKLLYVHDIHDVNATPNRRIAFTYNPADSYQFTAVTKYDVNSVVQTWNYNYVTGAFVENQGSNVRLASVDYPAVTALDAYGIESSFRPRVQYFTRNVTWDSANGLIEKIIETDGSWHTYEYFKNGRVFRVKQGEFGVATDDPNVDVQTFDYNIFKNQTEFTDERGNSEIYVHQKNGLLIKQIHADRSQLASKWGGVGTSDEYLMTETRDERGAIEDFSYYGVADPTFKRGMLSKATAKHYKNQTDLLVTKYDYEQPDASGKPHLVAPSTIVIDPDAGSYVGKKLTTTHQYYPSGDAKVKLWKIIDGENNVVEYTYYSNSDVVTPGNGTYRRGLLKSIKQPPVVDVAGNSVQYETLFDYDAAGNVTKSTTQTVVTAPAAPLVISESTFVYDSFGNVVQRIVGANSIADRVVTESIYDALGRLRETGFADVNAAIDPIDGFTSRFKYDAVGRVRESIDPLGRSTKFEYDRQGNVTKQVNPDNTVIQYIYDGFGNLIVSTDSLGRTTRYVYDSRNRLIQTLFADGSTERVRYDATGNVIAKIDALGFETTYKYDGAGRLLEAQLPDPDGPLNEDGGADLGSPTTTNKYDKLGNLIAIIDPELNVTQYKYDVLGRIIEARTLRESDVPANIRDKSTAVPATTRAAALITTDYDAVGNVSQTVTYDASTIATLPANPRDLVTLVNRIANKVQVVQMRYDAIGRLTKVINADKTSVTTEYDAAGRVRYQHDELDRVTEFRYDTFGRLDTMLQADPASGLISTTGSPTTSYRYDAAGNRVAVTDPRGVTTQYEFDVFNRAVSVIDAQGNRTRTVYDVAGQVVAAIDALGRTTYMLIDDRGRVIQQRQADPDGEGAGFAPVIRSRYDIGGRLVERVDALGNSTSYAHDRLGRVVRETFATDHRVIDGDLANWPDFAVYGATTTAVNQSADYGGDSLQVNRISPSVSPEAVWSFRGLAQGTYRVLASWTGLSSATWPVIFRLSDYYDETTGVTQTNFFPYDVINSAGYQQSATLDVLRFDNGAWNGWKELYAGFVIDSNGPGALGVHFTTGGPAFHADAIRIERIATRSYEYDHSGNLLTEIDPLGNQTTHVYDELNRQTVLTLPDPDGAGNNLPSPQTTTKFDSYGNVVRIVDRNSPATIADDSVVSYEYDYRNRRTREVLDVGGNEQTITDFRYDKVGNLIEKLELPHDAASWVLDAGDVGFHVQSGGSPSYPNLTSDYGGDSMLVPPPSATTNTVMFWKFDNLEPGAYRVLAHWNESPTATTNLFYRLSDYYYDDLNNNANDTYGTFFNLDVNDVDSTSLGSQRVHSTGVRRFDGSAWSDWQELSSGFMVGPNGPGSIGVQFATYGQPILADAIRIERIERRTSYKYDALNRLISQVENAGAYDVTDRHTTANQYDASGNLTKVEENPGVDPRQVATVYAYDSLGRLVAETEQGQVGGSTEKRTRRFQYDAIGNQVAHIDPMSRLTRSEYDRLGRLTKTIDPDPDGNNLVTALASHLTTSTYDAAGNLLSQTNGTAGETTRYKYDAQGRLILSENGRGDVTSHFYDLAGNLAETVDPDQNSTAYNYDGLGRKVSEATSAGTRQFIYDARGNLSITVNRNGEAIVQSYDRLNRPARSWEFVSLAEAQTPLSQEFIAFTDRFYDDLGRLVETRHSRRALPQQGPLDYRATDSYVYDGLGRLVEHSNQSLLSTDHSIGAPSQRQTYAYAYESGGLTETREQFVSDQFAAQTKSTFNAFGELVRLTDSDSGTTGASPVLDFDSMDAVFSYLGDGSLSSTIRYTDWEASLPGGAGHRNRAQATYAYDQAGRLRGISQQMGRRTTSTWSPNQQIANISYAYDAEDRINAIATDWNTSLWAIRNRTDESQSFTYDAAGQLTNLASNLPGQTAAYVYDANGNREYASEQGGGTDSYSIGELNRIDSDSTYSYEYDEEGNIVLAYLTNDPSIRYIYKWDHHNHLIKFTEASGDHETLIVDYRYNASGELIYRKVDRPFDSGAEVEHYAIESGRRTMTIESDLDVARRYQYGPTGESLFEQVFYSIGNQTSQFQVDVLMPMGDHQNSTRIVLGLDLIEGSEIYLRETIDYAAFGRVTSIIGSDGVSIGLISSATFGHHGDLFDTATGLQLKGARWYSADIGRFISEDPIEDGSNWYMFAGNDPVNYADPSGLSLQGYPLNGGFSGGRTVRSTIPSGALSTVGTPLGHAFNRSPQASNSNSTRPTAIEQFNNGLSAYSSASALNSITKPARLDYSLKPDPVYAAIKRYDESRTLEEFRGVIEAEFHDIAVSTAVRNKESVHIFGETWVMPWNPKASGILDTSKAYAYASGRAVSGTVSGALSGGLTGAGSGAVVGGIGGAAFGGAGAAPGALLGATGGAVIGTVWGGVSGLFGAANSETAGEAAQNGAWNGAITGTFLGAGAGVNAVRGVAAARTLSVAADQAIEAELALAPIAGGGARVSNLHPATRASVQAFADSSGTPVTVVGSRAAGTSHAKSDFDYLIGGNSRVRQNARRVLPRGESGGELGPRGYTGMDVFNSNKAPLDTSLPHIIFNPRP